MVSLRLRLAVSKSLKKEHSQKEVSEIGVEQDSSLEILPKKGKAKLSENHFLTLERKEVYENKMLAVLVILMQLIRLER